MVKGKKQFLTHQQLKDTRDNLEAALSIFDTVNENDFSLLVMTMDENKIPRKFRCL